MATTNDISEQQIQVASVSSYDPKLDNDTIVIDPGSFWTKVGLSGDDEPSITIPSIVGIFHGQTKPVNGEKYYWVGNEALYKRGSLRRYNPIEHGIVTDWEKMEKLLHFILYNELREDPKEHPILITEKVFNPKWNRETMTQLFFETFNVPAFYTAFQSVLSLYGSGRTNGMVLDSGFDVSHAVPIYQGYAITGCALRFDIGGRELIDHFVRLLGQKGHRFTSTAEREIARDMQQKYCYVAQNFDEELQVAWNSSELTFSYELPDGNVLDLNDERFKGPEVMFSPQMMGSDMSGIHDLTNHSIMKCDLDIRYQLYRNIVLAGGSTMYPGMRARMQKEISALALGNTDVKVFASETGMHSAWIGGSILSALSTFEDMWITKAEYEENGPDIVNRKCSI